MCKVNPRVDFAFKRLFGVKENSDLLISLLNAILSPSSPIKAIELLNPYNEKQSSTDKLSILDIKACDDRDQFYNIEVQMGNQINYDKRALYYWSKVYTDRLSSGKSYSKLKKTIGIHILNFNYFKKEPRYHNIYEIRNRDSNRRHFENFEFHFIELDKFDVAQSPLKSLLERWVTFLKSEGLFTNQQVLKVLQSDPKIKKALDTLERINFTEEEREIYDAQLKRLWDDIEEIRTAHDRGLKKGMEKGMEKGRAEGKAEGKAEGIQEGMEKGMEKAKLATALKLIASGQTIEFSSEITGLSITSIKAHLPR